MNYFSEEMLTTFEERNADYSTSGRGRPVSTVMVCTEFLNTNDYCIYQGRSQGGFKGFGRTPFSELSFLNCDTG